MLFESLFVATDSGISLTSLLTYKFSVFLFGDFFTCNFPQLQTVMLLSEPFIRQYRRHLYLVIDIDRSGVRLDIPDCFQVFLRCGSEEKFVDIDEPRLCSYNLTFETPLACPEDAFQGMQYL